MHNYSRSLKKARPLAVRAEFSPSIIKTSLSRPALVRLYTAWRRDCQIAQHSNRTLDNCKKVFDMLVWHLDETGQTECGTEQLREFFAYMCNPFETSHDGTGRWGEVIAVRKQAGRALKPASVLTYFGRLRAFFNWCVQQHELDASPLNPIKLPDNKQDQIKPFTREQIDALLVAARHSPHSKRDTAILLLLLDTAMRVSEICGLKVADVDTTAKSCTVFGKGGKTRTVYFGRETATAIWRYRSEPRNVDLPEDAPLFRSDRGDSYGEALTDSGMRQLFGRLGDAAGITGVRCSPHTVRHTAAVWLLSNGANAFTVKEILGHTTLTITQRYVNFAQADIERIHKTHSPVDNMRRSRAF